MNREHHPLHIKQPRYVRIIRCRKCKVGGHTLVKINDHYEHSDPIICEHLKRERTRMEIAEASRQSLSTP